MSESLSENLSALSAGYLYVWESKIYNLSAGNLHVRESKLYTLNAGYRHVCLTV